MLYFKNDYSEGACPEVLEALVRSNDEHLAGYGADIYLWAALLFVSGFGFASILKFCKKEFSAK